MRKDFDVSGMGCAACSARIENGLNGTEGVIKAEVSLLTNSMTVDFDEKIIDEEGICQKVRDLGYDASLKNPRQ
ncbi:MAG: cation transporter [Clostridia bacterium]|nr:cation transporter [Clostridia bacterium]